MSKIGNKSKPENVKVRKIAETVKTSLIAVLVLSLLSLVVVYISGTDIYRSMTDVDVGKKFNRLWNAQSSYSNDGLDPDRLLPEMIGYAIQGSSPRASIADAESAEVLYSALKPCLDELFGKNSACRRLDAEEGKAKFSAGLASGEFVYVRYHKPVLYQLIFAYMSEKAAVSADETAICSNDYGAYVSELVIIPDDHYAAHRFVAYAHDGEGGYYEFKPGDDLISSAFFITEFDAFANELPTYKLSFSDGSMIPEGHPIIDGELKAVEIIEQPVGFFQETLKKILEIFEYNPEKLTGYEDESGWIFVYANSRIKIDSGNISYRSNSLDNGLPISGILGYSLGESATVLDMTAAVDRLISDFGEISQKLIGGNAMLCLGDVYVDNSMIVVEYYHTYNNIRISGDPAVRAVFAGDRLYGFEMSIADFDDGEDICLSLRQDYVLKHLYPESSDRPEEMRFIYKNGKADWYVVYEGNGSSAVRAAGKNLFSSDGRKSVRK